jgi:hypothetical protein
MQTISGEKQLFKLHYPTKQRLAHNGDSKAMKNLTSRSLEKTVCLISEHQFHQDLL